MSKFISITNTSLTQWIKSLALYVAVVALLASSSFSTFASDNFVRLNLPRNVSIELPKNWVVISDNQRITLDSTVEAGLDLAGLEKENSTLPFAANYYDDNGNTAGIINIRYYPELDLSQGDAQQATEYDVSELDAAVKENQVKGLEAFGMYVRSWQGTKKTTVNGIVVFQTEYRRNSIKSSGVFRVRLIRVFSNNRSFTLTVSYRESDEWFLGKITDRVIASLRM